MKRIIIHWTAGVYYPNCVDLKHYHFLVDAQGNIHNGLFKPEDNENCSDGIYAQHTGGGNTGSIGVAMCGMFGYCSPDRIGKYPLTAIQCERTFCLIAKLVKKYNIVLSPNTVLTHYEFGKTHPNTSSFGKIDIVYLPPYKQVITNNIGSFIRNKVKWYLDKV